jgi:2-thiouracil desulfurase
MRHPSETTNTPIRIGISACLLGEKVRFDAGHKRDAFIVETLGPFFHWIPVCPEMEIGLGSKVLCLMAFILPENYT